MKTDIYRLPQKGFGFIYKYTSPNGKSYVGQTTTSLIVRSGKRGKMYRGCKVFYKAIIKYGFKSFKPEILGEYPQGELDKWEEYFINKLNTLVPYGYNLKTGGQSTSRKYKPIYAYNLDGTFYRKFFNQNDARKEFNINGGDISRCIKGELKFVKGKIWKDKYFEKVEPVLTGKNGAKPVVQINPITNQQIAVFNSASEAARSLGLSRPSGISKACKGKLKTSAGFKWQFLQSSTTKNL